jgi:hypothetical protein
MAVLPSHRPKLMAVPLPGTEIVSWPALAQQSRGIVQECRVTAQQCTATLIAAHDALARSRELEVAVQDFMAQLRDVGPR